MEIDFSFVGSEFRVCELHYLVFVATSANHVSQKLNWNEILDLKLMLHQSQLTTIFSFYFCHG